MFRKKDPQWLVRSWEQKGGPIFFNMTTVIGNRRTWTMGGVGGRLEIRKWSKKRSRVYAYCWRKWALPKKANRTMTTKADSEFSCICCCQNCYSHIGLYRLRRYWSTNTKENKRLCKGRTERERKREKGFVLVVFYGISTFLDHLMLNPVTYIYIYIYIYIGFVSK